MKLFKYIPLLRSIYFPIWGGGGNRSALVVTCAPKARPFERKTKWLAKICWWLIPCVKIVIFFFFLFFFFFFFFGWVFFLFFSSSFFVLNQFLGQGIVLQNFWRHVQGLARKDSWVWRSVWVSEIWMQRTIFAWRVQHHGKVPSLC